MSAFCGDIHLEEEFKRLIEAYRIKTIVETGTYDGRTTKVLATFGPVVHTIELDPGRAAEASAALVGLSNVYQHGGDSRTVLKQIIASIEKPALYFLDAHWGDDNPLVGELEIIAANDPSPVIVCHDFKVPGREFGYDVYHGRAYEFEWIEPALVKIKAPWTHYYNSEAAGHRRGVLFVVPDAGVN